MSISNSMDSIEEFSGDLNQIFGPDGIIANHIKGYIYRPQQLELVKKINEAFINKKILLAEAGTGTGKTLAYLIPALLSAGKILISTGTKNLQNQLYFRDLPIALKALKLFEKTALLKGRNNYLCKYRLEIALTDILLATSEMVEEFKQIVAWSESTTDGDTSTIKNISETSDVWRYVTSTADNCLGHECPAFKHCFVYKARQAALDAKIIVINHHLLLSDWGLKAENDEAKLLPDGVNLILDEAHQLANIASLHFGSSVSSRKIKDLIQDVNVEYRSIAKDVKQLVNIPVALNRLLEQMQSYLQTKPDRGFYNSLYQEQGFKDDLDNLNMLLKDLNSVLEANSTRSKGLENCYNRLGSLLLELEQFILPTLHVKNDMSSKTIKWYEVFKQNFMLKHSPLEVSDLFYEKLTAASRACVLTSATLSVGGDFSLIKKTLGLAEADTIIIPSPFDYKNKSILYLPRNMPDPMADNYIDSYVKNVLPVLEYSQGRAFLLFTSFSNMHRVYEYLKTHNNDLDDKGYSLLMQGNASKSALIEQFTANERSILLATASFWEGIDVKGPDLHCVVIDKLPFASPTEPLLQAKIKHMQEQGINAFIELQCQEAALQLTQGAGRLIRSEEDYGVLMICDPRIISRPYGELFLRALPPMRRTRNLSVIKDFYEQLLL